MRTRIYNTIWGPDAQTALYLGAITIPAMMASIGLKMLGH